MKKNILLCIACMVMLLTSCGLREQKEQSADASPTAPSVKTVAVEKEGPTATSAPTAPSKTAKKTVKEAFGAWLDEDYITQWRKECFSEVYDDVRYDDISEWKGKQGNYQYPKGYSMEHRDNVSMASQQMPQGLLDEISTEELYQLIMNTPPEDGIGSTGWNSFHETYLQMLAVYYTQYNFIENLMEREDAAQVVHKYYQQYTKKDIEKYSKQNRVSNADSYSEMRKEGNFQLTEGLEWFFLYKEGKKVPDYQVLGYDLMKTW